MRRDNVICAGELHGMEWSICAGELHSDMYHIKKMYFIVMGSYQDIFLIKDYHLQEAYDDLHRPFWTVIKEYLAYGLIAHPARASFCIQS